MGWAEVEPLSQEGTQKGEIAKPKQGQQEQEVVIPNIYQE